MNIIEKQQVTLGNGFRAPLSDYEREMHIRHCGYLMQEAMRSGNKPLARVWLKAKTEAIGQRSPEQQARMEAEIERAISEGNDFFQAQGAADARGGRA